MGKPIDIQYTYRKEIGFTEEQRISLQILKNHGVNINQFIRQATKEKIQREWKHIKAAKKRKEQKIPNSPDWL